MFLKAAMMGLITFTKSFYVDCTFRLYTYEYVVCQTPVDISCTHAYENIYAYTYYLLYIIHIYIVPLNVCLEHHDMI